MKIKETEIKKQQHALVYLNPFFLEVEALPYILLN